MSCHDHPHSDDQDHGGPTAKRAKGLAILAGDEPTPASRQWRSIEERAGSPEIVKAAQREFPAGASELDGVSRRGFVQLLGTSIALTSAAACRRPNQPIVPYVRRPPEVTPGNSLHFATASVVEGYGLGLVVESYEGRPTKVEGNPDHPDTAGAATVQDQAAPLALYDNDRAKQLRHNGAPIDWRSLLGVLARLGEKHAADGGAKLRFLVEPTGSPLLNDLRARILARFPRAKFVAYSATAAEGATQGAQLAFGRPLEVRHTLDRATVVLALDSDFLHDGPEHVRLSRQLAAARTPGPEMNRLYVAEPCLTPTGSLADHRLRIRGSEVLALTQALVAALANQPGGESLRPLADLPRTPGNVDARWVSAVVKDLLRARGRSAIIAGRRQPAAVHALVAAMNAALGNVGTTVTLWAPVAADAAGSSALRGLAEEIAAGQVETLVVSAYNPAYTAPADLRFGKLLERVPNSIYFARYEDETAASVKTFVPAAHELESWGDVRGTDGTVSIIQPLIAPLWSSITEADLLGAFVGEGDKGSFRLVREFWQRRAGNVATFDATWETWLAKGVVENSAARPESAPAVNAGALAGALGAAMTAATPKGQGLELAFAIDPKVHDGRFANNPWLQELPHPITKITWDNAVLISQATANQLGVATSDIVQLEIGDRQVTGPVYVQPGHADDAITVALGYGRQGAESVARGVGFNVGLLRTSDAPWFVRGVALTKKAKNYRFGITQDHWSMEGRNPAKSAPLAEFGKHDSKINEELELNRGKLPSIQAPVDYSQQAYKWGMAIDLNKCNGCNACVIACQSENNIPVVGRENVRIGREMHWLRVDRYYEGSVEDPEVVTQPMLCQHCETAPCEYVCPVNATVHSDEGLNEMVYNRCIGTRYCSNNCPYKVRRFNFLDYHGEPPPVRKMAANPDVTVRSRGVMEKCTFCVQRIERARIDSRVEGRLIKDGELQTACQQGCPSGAIQFGNLNDGSSVVSKLHNDPRRYYVLHELNTRPRIAYLARVRNPNPELA